MNHDAAVDLGVKLVVPASVVEPDDPARKLFFDRTTETGVRLLAVAEPVNRTEHGFLTASLALNAFEEALLVTIRDGIEPGLYRAFAAANDAVRATNKRTMSSLRAFAGITAAVIDGENATIGYVPPGQALILQDGRVYGVPDLATWEPGFMPWADGDEPEPLGFAAVARPQFRKTKIGNGDQFMLGESAVGRALAAPAAEPLADLTEEGMLDRVERGLADSGVEDAYAAWFRVEHAAPVDPVNEEKMHRLEALWHGETPETTHEPEAPHQPGSPALSRAMRREQWHDKLIETSERIFGRKESEILPLDAKRRAVAPVSAGTLHRYVAPHHPTLTPWFRSWLPRGLRLPQSRRSLAAMLILVVAVAAAAVTHNVRDTRASKQDQLFDLAESELQLANSAETKDLALQHIELADRALDNALKNGADLALVNDWRSDLGVVSDRWNGITRLVDMRRIGSFPSLIDADRPMLILAGGNLYVIAGGVYLVSETDQALLPMLEVGEKIDNRRVGSLVSATADGDDLVVTDGKAVFRLDEQMSWSSARLAQSTETTGWQPLATGSYKESFYLFDEAEKQINKFDGDAMYEEPVDWLDDDAAKHATHVVDMVVAGDIFLLTTDGSVFSFNSGEDKDRYEIPDAGEKAEMIALDGGAGREFVYVLASENKRGMVVKYAPADQERWLVLAPESFSAGYSKQASDALATASDFVIDESTSTIYFVTSSGIWRATLG